MIYFNFLTHWYPANKNIEPEPEEIENDADPNFDESTSQGGEYIDDSLRMKEQPFEKD